MGDFHILMQVKKRKEGTGEPQKFMGCGSCDNLSKSVTVILCSNLYGFKCLFYVIHVTETMNIYLMQIASATNHADILLRVSKQMFASFHLGWLSH